MFSSAQLELDELLDELEKLLELDEFELELVDELDVELDETLELDDDVEEELFELELDETELDDNEEELDEKELEQELELDDAAGTIDTRQNRAVTAANSLTFALSSAGRNSSKQS